MLWIENINDYNQEFYQNIILPNDISIKYDKYYFEKDKKVCKISFFLKKKLSEFLKIKLFILKYNSYGKPYLLDNESNIVNFNISHHSNLVVLYYDQNKNVGIDILNKNEVKLFSFKCPFFSKEENIYVDNIDKFCKIWTSKEAYSKCLGTGLNNNLKNINMIKYFNSNKYNDLSIEFIELKSYLVCICKKN